MTARRAAARALANVALVKYFGKRDAALNLPAAGSLSVALEPLATVTEVALDAALDRDEVLLDGVPADAAFAARVTAFLDIVRGLAGSRTAARVATRNGFPTGAGLASSASGFAALALAAVRALGVDLDEPALSALARRGSGSAARSIPGGFAVWEVGARADGADSFARRIAAPEDLDLRVVVGVSDPGPKPLGSTAAMERTRTTSPYYASWVDAARVDLGDAIAAVEGRDLERLGEIAERSALAMHAAALAARPGIAFWNGATIEALHRIRALRGAGHLAFFTCDAGPQPKALCAPADENAVAAAFADVPGIRSLIRCRPGGGAVLAPQPDFPV
jgi:diphosphomevalonate decarboxylase